MAVLAPSFPQTGLSGEIAEPTSYDLGGDRDRAIMIEDVLGHFVTDSRCCVGPWT